MSSYLTSTERRAEQATRAAGNQTTRAATTMVDLMTSSGLAWFDMMLNMQRQMQRTSLQSLSAYSPTAETRISAQLPSVPSVATLPTVIPVGEERLNVATHTILGETTRIRRRVVSQPVEHQITLRDETVVVERRPALNPEPTPGLLTETVVEMSDSRQVPTVWKSLHVAEEVVLRKQVSLRTEKVRETVRHDVVEIEHSHSNGDASHATEAMARATDSVAAAARDTIEAGRDMTIAAAREATREPRRDTAPDTGPRPQSLAEHEAKSVQAGIDKDKAEAEKKALGLTPIASPKKP